MFKKILESLTTQFKGVDARILTRKARELAKQVKTEDDIKEAVEAVTLMDLIEMESARNTSEATKKAIENYEKEHNLINGKPVTTKGGKPSDEEEDEDPDEEGEDGNEGSTPSNGGQPKAGKGNPKYNRKQSALERKIASLADTVGKLTTIITDMKQEKTSKSRRQQVEELLEGADDKVKNRYLRDFDRLNFKDDEDFNQWLEERSPEFTEEIQALGGTEGGTEGQTTPTPKPNRVTPPIGGRSTQQKGEVSAEVKAYLDAEAAKESANSFSTIAGIPQANPTPQTNG
ncbi:hypothetical protein [Prevotella histicola]